MTTLEFSDQFDVLYNNINSNQAPGLDEYEKSVFLTKAQDEIIKKYFDPRLNKAASGFDGSETRQIDFSALIKTNVIPSYVLNSSELDSRDNVECAVFPSDLLICINEFVDVLRGPELKDTDVVVVDGITNSVTSSNITIGTPPENTKDMVVSGVYYSRPMEKLVLKCKKDSESTYYYSNCRPYIGNTISNKYSDGGTFLIPKRDESKVFVYSLNQKALYTYDYARKELSTSKELNPKLIRLAIDPISYTEYARAMTKPYKRPSHYKAWRVISANNLGREVTLLPGNTDRIISYTLRYIRRPKPIILDYLEGVSIEGLNTTQECELDPILHEEILQRAVELAKAAYIGDLQSQIGLGGVSQTDIGLVPQATNNRDR